MKKTALIAGLIVSGTILGAATPAFAADPNLDSKASITFIENKDGGGETDPHEDKPVKPDPDKPGTGGSLSIDKVSDFNFGSQKISTSDQTYPAQKEKRESLDGTEVFYAQNQVQITDNRGEETPSGWGLSVKQNGQFKTASGKVLTGAKISFSDGHVKNNTYIDASGVESEAVAASHFAKQTTFDLDPDATSDINVLDGLPNGATGRTHFFWGTDARQAVPSDGSVPVTDAVKLFVPGSTSKVKDSLYSTTITWTLKQAPNNVVPN